ncbi:Pentalenene oxygenase [Pirellulimonas nuda]|uniref:Pentalenene oxygenase n=1 Tax=Pirellulimonas nuda TaxID=2528009 RepID=A0A518DCJ3_9BACT|nr:cytochrome P450 [Pirellulimonas nuda]QDU89202.1 Pentalenene oxygenase [Pirellulimonas nuda]
MTPSKPPAEFSGALASTPWSYRVWMLAFSRERLFDKLIAEYGDFVHYRGVVGFYLINHPALVKQVLQQTHDAFDKRSPLYDRFRRAFGSGLVVAEGDQWKQRRAAIQQLMGPARVEAYLQPMLGAAHRVAHQWESRSRDGAAFDVADQMDELTLEIVGRALFQDAFDEAREPIRRWTHVIDHYSSKAPLPVVRSAWFPSRLNRRLRTTLAEFHRFIQTTIDQRRAEASGKDLLSLLLADDPADGRPRLTDAEVRDEVLGMIVGGHETSSVALTWIWYELAKNPLVERRLHEELDTVLGGREMRVEDAPRLTYARMVIDETLRLHPPFWFENRNVTRDVELGGVTLPAGAMVAFSRHALHRHKDFWADPSRFDPERFRPGAEENRRSTHAYVPFGGGPRVCVGVHFATLELLVLLATLAQRFRLQIDGQGRHEASALLTMRLKHGLRVKAIQR